MCDWLLGHVYIVKYKNSTLFYALPINIKTLSSQFEEILNFWKVYVSYVSCICLYICICVSVQSVVSVWLLQETDNCRVAKIVQCSSRKSFSISYLDTIANCRNLCSFLKHTGQRNSGWFWAWETLLLSFIRQEKNVQWCIPTRWQTSWVSTYKFNKIFYWNHLQYTAFIQCVYGQLYLNV
jgi:hypothetical protein